jgi:hypothetical protein
MVPQPIDRSVVSHLDVSVALTPIGDQHALGEILAILVDMLAQDLPKLAASVKIHDHAQSVRLLHSSKGCFPFALLEFRSWT